MLRVVYLQTLPLTEMINETILYLARHGETLWNTQQRFQGQLDSDLTELGQQQSRQLAQSLRDKGIDLIVSSVQGRSIATANICQQRLTAPMITNNHITERNLGQWQGQYLSQLQTESIYYEVLQQYTDIAPAKGESAKACGVRINNALNNIAKQSLNKNILIIFHGEALRCFLLQLGQQLNDHAYNLFANGSICKLRYQHNNETFQLCTF